jgi:hypothetical protein
MPKKHSDPKHQAYAFGASNRSMWYFKKYRRTVFCVIKKIEKIKEGITSNPPPLLTHRKQLPQEFFLFFKPF